MEFGEFTMNLFPRQRNRKKVLISKILTTAINLRFCHAENPHSLMKGHNPSPQKLKVWTGIVGNRI